MGTRNHRRLTLRSLDAEANASSRGLPAIDTPVTMSSPVSTSIGSNPSSSPRASRKRTNDEVYVPDNALHSIQNHPRPSTAPEQRSHATAHQMRGLENTAPNSSSASHPSHSVTSTNVTLKPESTDRSLTRMNEPSSSFQETIQRYQDELDQEYGDFERKLQARERNGELDEFDWEGLENRYRQEIEPKISAEREVMQECSALFKVRLQDRSIGSTDII